MQTEEHPTRLGQWTQELKKRWREYRGSSSEPFWRLRPFWRLINRRLRKQRPATTANSMLPVLIKVFAGFSKMDGEVDEQDIDSSLGFLRYDYPEAIYSELRALYSQALQQSQDLDEMAAELAKVLSHEEKLLLGVQLYVLISRGVQLHREQLIQFYLFMTNLGVASEAIDLVYQLNRDSIEEVQDSPGTQPLEFLYIGGEEPADLVIETLPSSMALLAFRFRNHLLLKNIGSGIAIVRGRQLLQSQFCRLYEGQRVVLADAVLDYQDLTFYFNAKKDLSAARLFLTIESNGQPVVEPEATRNTHLEIRFGLKISVSVLRDSKAQIGEALLEKGLAMEVAMRDTISFPDNSQITFHELHRRARELGGRFELTPSRTEYLVSNDPGRLEPGDILLSSRALSEVLLRIRCDYVKKRGELEILSSAQPVLVNGAPVREQAALPNDATVSIGDDQFLRCHFADRIISEETNVINKLEARELGHTYDGKETALDGINFTARRGEMICVMGPSGCGKSTLLRVLSGHQKANQGQVFLNGFRLYDHHAELTPYICYIPQEDAFDPHLTIQENIDYAVAIRSPHLTRRERRRRVDAKLVELGLNERRHRLAGTPKDKFLSGGERKRLNVGMDMIGLADVYLIDEPTSGLSSKDSEHVLEIIRGLAHHKIVLVSIHQPSTRLFHLFDKAMLLDQGGKLAFYGTPQEMLHYFEDAQNENLVPVGQVGTEVTLETHDPDRAGTPDSIFDVLETPLSDLGGTTIYEEDQAGHLAPVRRFSPNFWRDRYQAYRTMREVKHRDEDDSRTQHNAPVLPTMPSRKIGELITTTATFFPRAFLSKLRNRGNLATTLLEAPLLALLISLVLRWSEEDRYTFGSAFHIPAYLFLSLVVAMFLGLTNSADEIIRDRALLTRERNLGSRLFNYLGTKLFSLGIFAAAQCAIYILIGNGVLAIRGMFWYYFLWLFLTSMCGVIMGLLISSVVSDVKTALNVVPLILLPQIILGGALIKYQEMNRDLPILSSIKRWTHQETEVVENPLQVPLICEFMPLRWSYESLVVSQGTYNPLAKVLTTISDRVDELTSKDKLTEVEEDELSDLKEARTIVLQLEGRHGRKVAREVKRLHRRVRKNKFFVEKYEHPPDEPYINVKEVFRNKKIRDLLDRSAIEVMDHRREDEPWLNVFFGTEKMAFGQRYPTVWVNFVVMIGFIALSAAAVWTSLKYQLTRT